VGPLNRQWCFEHGLRVTQRQNPAVIRMLLEHGADASFKITVGETAVDWARKINLSGFPEQTPAVSESTR